MFDYYKTSDLAIEMLSKKAAKRLSDCKAKLGVAGFDELNVMKEVIVLYNGMDEDNRKAFRDVARTVYRKIKKYVEDSYPEYLYMISKKTIAETLSATWTDRNVLSKPNPLTKYVYDNEVTRKQHKGVEAVNSVEGKSTKGIELTKNVRYWAGQTRFYCDIVTDEAVKEAYRAMGIKKVRWETGEDEKVCVECSELNGKVFAIENVPDKPHLNCRCKIVPYVEE